MRNGFCLLLLLLALVLRRETGPPSLRYAMPQPRNTPNPVIHRSVTITAAEVSRSAMQAIGPPISHAIARDDWRWPHSAGKPLWCDSPRVFDFFSPMQISRSTAENAPPSPHQASRLHPNYSTGSRRKSIILKGTVNTNEISSC